MPPSPFSREQEIMPHFDPTAVEVPSIPAREDGRGHVAPPPQRRHDFAQLSRQVKRAGLLDRRTGYYAAKVGLNGLLLATGWTAFILLGDSWYQMLTAAFLAVVFTQIAFIAHDAGHRQVLRGRRANDRVGLVHANLLVGIGFRWWVGKHNRHHANPNNVDHDPDVTIGAVAFTVDQASGKRGVFRLIARYQAYLIFPLLLLEAAQLHAASVKALLRSGIRSAWPEALLLLAHAIAYLTAVLLVLPPFKAIAFILVQQGLFGLYLGLSFAPNHKGMAMLTDQDELDYLQRQVLTSRNVRGGWFVDFALGGLNYQIEHHLFPNMPRPNLRRAQALVRAFCLDRGLPYTECGALRSYAQALGHLDQVGEPLRPISAADAADGPRGPRRGVRPHGRANHDGDGSSPVRLESRRREDGVR
jgi:fatty acid desaturase